MAPGHSGGSANGWLLRRRSVPRGPVATQPSRPSLAERERRHTSEVWVSLDPDRLNKNGRAYAHMAERGRGLSRRPGPKCDPGPNAHQYTSTVRIVPSPASYRLTDQGYHTNLSEDSLTRWAHPADAPFAHPHDRSRPGRSPARVAPAPNEGSFSACRLSADWSKRYKRSRVLEPIFVIRD